MKARTVLDSMTPYVAGRLVPGKIKLASNENPLGPSPEALAAAHNALANSNLYPDGASRDLKAALAAHYGLAENQFLLGNGSDEVLVMIAATFLNPDDAVLVGANTFSEYRFASKLFEANVRAVPLRDGCFDTQAFLAACDAKTRAIFLCSPNNPTGGLIPKAALLDFLSRVPQDVLVVLDAAYSEYVDDPAENPYPDEKHLLARFSNLIILHTFSKIYGLAGLRIGYAMANPALIDYLERVRQPFNVSIPAQAAAIAALQDHQFVQRSFDLNSQEKQRLYTEFKRLGLAFLPSQANFIAIDTGFDAKLVYEAILERGLTIRPCASFGLDKHIRISIGTAEQNTLLISALAEAMASLKQSAKG